MKLQPFHPRSLLGLSSHMPENHLPVHYTPDESSNSDSPIAEATGGEVHIPRSGSTHVDDLPPKGSQLGKCLAMTALLAVIAWNSLLTPKWIPTCVAQAMKQPHEVSAEIKKCDNTSLNETRQSPSVTLNCTKKGCTSIAPKMQKAAKAKTSKNPRKASFIVPPPPPTPCVLPPGFALSPAQQAAPTRSVQAAQPVPPANIAGSPQDAAVASSNNNKQGTTGGAIDALYTEELLTLSGSISSGNTVSVTVYNASLSGGQQTASVTATSSSITTTLAALAAAINDNKALSAAGVTAIAGTNNSNITLLNTSSKVTSYAASATGSATVTLSDL